jgi:hypothetical protein
MSDMNINKQIEQVVREVFKEENVQEEQHFRAEVASCLTFARAREFSLDPAQATQRELDHTHTCEHCNARVRAFQTALHPSVEELLRYSTGLLESSRAEEVRRHLQDGKCWQCSRLKDMRGFGAALEVSRRGRGVFEKLQDLLRASIWTGGYCQRPVRVFASTRPMEPPFSSRVNSGSLSVEIYEAPRDSLVIQVETKNPELAGRAVYIEIAGEGATLSAIVRLNLDGEYYVGQHLHEGFQELRRELGAFLILIIPQAEELGLTA